VPHSKPSKAKASFWQTKHVATVLSLVEAGNLRGKTADQTAKFKLVLWTGDCCLQKVEVVKLMWAEHTVL
jgi:hypothetical protein